MVSVGALDASGRRFESCRSDQFLLDMETLIMTLDQIYCRGYDAAMSGSMTIGDCPYRDWEWQEKRAWVLGFIEGLRTLYY